MGGCVYSGERGPQCLAAAQLTWGTVLQGLWSQPSAHSGSLEVGGIEN